MIVVEPSRCLTCTSHQLLSVSNTSDMAPSALVPHCMHIANLTHNIQTKHLAYTLCNTTQGDFAYSQQAAHHTSLCTAGHAALCCTAVVANAMDVDSAAPDIISLAQGTTSSTASLPCESATPVAVAEHEMGDVDKVSACMLHSLACTVPLTG